VVYNEERMGFLKEIVQTRYRCTDLFCTGKLMRPPVVRTDIQPVTSSGITMRQVVAGVWQTGDGSKTVLFIVNISKETAAASVRLYPEEYGIRCPDNLELILEPMSVKVIEF